MDGLIAREWESFARPLVGQGCAGTQLELFRKVFYLGWASAVALHKEAGEMPGLDAILMLTNVDVELQEFIATAKQEIDTIQFGVRKPS
jgi:hypothetical protein